MQNVKFNENGGPIIVEVKCGHAQIGTYTILLWESNDVLKEWKGNFINPEDDLYELPSPNKRNSGRIVDCLFTITLTPPIKDYYVELRIMQDGKELGIEKASGQSDIETITKELCLQLEA